MFEVSLEAKLPTIWTDGKVQPGRSSDTEKERREKIRDGVGEDQRGRKSEERRCGARKGRMCEKDPRQNIHYRKGRGQGHYKAVCSYRFVRNLRG